MSSIAFFARSLVCCQRVPPSLSSFGTTPSRPTYFSTRCIWSSGTKMRSSPSKRIVRHSVVAVVGADLLEADEAPDAVVDVHHVVAALQRLGSNGGGATLGALFARTRQHAIENLVVGENGEARPAPR